MNQTPFFQPGLAEAVTATAREATEDILNHTADTPVPQSIEQTVRDITAVPAAVSTAQTTLVTPLEDMTGFEHLMPANVGEATMGQMRQAVQDAKDGKTPTVVLDSLAPITHDIETDAKIPTGFAGLDKILEDGFKQGEIMTILPKPSKELLRLQEHQLPVVSVSAGTVVAEQAQPVEITVQGRKVYTDGFVRFAHDLMFGWMLEVQGLDNQPVWQPLYSLDARLRELVALNAQNEQRFPQELRDHLQSAQSAQMILNPTVNPDGTVTLPAGLSGPVTVRVDSTRPQLPKRKPYINPARQAKKAAKKAGKQ